MRYDYPEIIGHKVSGIIDRPMGSRHPRDYDMCQVLWLKTAKSRTFICWGQEGR